jgi:CO/xanthine dehydrogenase Mo-binding subunit
VLTNAYSVYTNTVPGGAFRGFGGPQVAFAYETQIDMIAARLGMDPFEIRMKNLLERGESFSDGDTPIDCDLKAGLRSVAEAMAGIRNKQTKWPTAVHRYRPAMKMAA